MKVNDIQKCIFNIKNYANKIQKLTKQLIMLLKILRLPTVGLIITFDKEKPHA